MPTNPALSGGQPLEYAHAGPADARPSWAFAKASAAVAGWLLPIPWAYACFRIRDAMHLDPYASAARSFTLLGAQATTLLVGVAMLVASRRARQSTVEPWCCIAGSLWWGAPVLALLVWIDNWPAMHMAD